MTRAEAATIFANFIEVNVNYAQNTATLSVAAAAFSPLIDAYIDKSVIKAAARALAAVGDTSELT